jgi:hypothetical protein
MRRLLLIVVVVAVLLIVGVAGLGFYREWFHFGTANPESGQTEIQLRIDRDKIKTDVEKAREQVSPVKADTEGH